MRSLRSLVYAAIEVELSLQKDPTLEFIITDN